MAPRITWLPALSSAPARPNAERLLELKQAADTFIKDTPVLRKARSDGRVHAPFEGQQDDYLDKLQEAAHSPAARKKSKLTQWEKADISVRCNGERNKTLWRVGLVLLHEQSAMTFFNARDYGGERGAEAAAGKLAAKLKLVLQKVPKGEVDKLKAMLNKDARVREQDKRDAAKVKVALNALVKKAKAMQ